MTVCLPFSKIRFLTVNPRTGYILLGFIMFIIIYSYQEFYYLNDIGTVPVSCLCLVADVTKVLTHIQKESILAKANLTTKYSH